ncbi:hypothetical protein E2I00_018542, partial [Balaenoptera physalus]
WMTAGRGIVHAEMPCSEEPVHGLQLWVNLRSPQKMVEPRYQELKSNEIPKPSKEGVTVAVISGEALGVKGQFEFFKIGSGNLFSPHYLSPKYKAFPAINPSLLFLDKDVEKLEAGRKEELTRRAKLMAEVEGKSSANQKYTSASVKSQHQIFRLSELSPEEDKGFASQQEKQYQHQRLRFPGWNDFYDYILGEFYNFRSLHQAKPDPFQMVPYAPHDARGSDPASRGCCPCFILIGNLWPQLALGVTGLSAFIYSKIYTYTPTLYLDFKLGQGAKHSHPIPKGWTSFIYTISGNVYIAEMKMTLHINTEINRGHTTDDKDLEAEAEHQQEVDPERSHFVLIAGEPLREPVVQHGPFVMNTDEEISQAILDFRNAKNGFERAKTWKSKIGN